jgi:hypothetical protein
MQKIIQIYPCLQKLSRKQDTILKISDFSTKIEQFWPFEDISICNYHYLGWVLTWKYLKQGFWGKILVYG